MNAIPPGAQNRRTIGDQHATTQGQKRILLFGLPRLLTEIIRRAIEEQADMEVVVPQRNGRRAIDLDGVDVIVIAYDDQQAAVRMLRDRPELRVFALAAHGRESLLYECRPHRVALGEMSPRELIAHIRAGRTDDEPVLSTDTR